MNTKIKVVKAGYFAGKWEEAGAEVELTERQLGCVKRRNREFEILDGPDKGTVVAGSGEGGEEPEGETGTTGGEGESDKEPAKVTVKDLKAALDEKGVEYPANAKKDELQALLDGADAQPDPGTDGEDKEDLM